MGEEGSKNDRANVSVGDDLCVNGTFFTENKLHCIVRHDPFPTHIGFCNPTKAHMKFTIDHPSLLATQKCEC